MESQTYTQALRKTHRALARAGKLKAVAKRVGEIRGWKPHTKEYRTVSLWESNLVKMFDPERPQLMRLDVYLAVREELGYDPLSGTAA